MNDEFIAAVVVFGFVAAFVAYLVRIIREDLR